MEADEFSRGVHLQTAANCSRWEGTGDQDDAMIPIATAAISVSGWAPYNGLSFHQISTTIRMTLAHWKVTRSATPTSERRSARSRVPIAKAANASAMRPRIPSSAAVWMYALWTLMALTSGKYEGGADGNQWWSGMSTCVLP